MSVSDLLRDFAAAKGSLTPAQRAAGALEAQARRQTRLNGRWWTENLHEILAAEAAAGRNPFA